MYLKILPSLVPDFFSCPHIGTKRLSFLNKGHSAFKLMERGSVGEPSEAAVVAPSGCREVAKYEGPAKRRRYDRCFSFMQEISIDPKVKSLKHLDSKKFRSEIKRWAKAVVTYARQVSNRFGSSRRSHDSGESSP